MAALTLLVLRCRSKSKEHIGFITLHNEYAGDNERDT